MTKVDLTQWKSEVETKAKVELDANVRVIVLVTNHMCSFQPTTTHSSFNTSKRSQTPCLTFTNVVTLQYATIDMV